MEKILQNNMEHIRDEPTFYVDIIFLAVYVFTTIILLISGYKTFRRNENKSIFSILTVLFILLTLLSKCHFGSHMQY